MKDNNSKSSHPSAVIISGSDCHGKGFKFESYARHGCNYDSLFKLPETEIQL